MNPRYGLMAGAAIAGSVALVLGFAPTSWLANLLDVAGADATAFLVRRYAASATAALFVAIAGIAVGLSPQLTGLLALATWFAVQAMVAIAGIVLGTVGGAAWLAVLADPLISAWFFTLSRNVQPNSPRSHR